MRICPTCHQTYGDEAATCPRDGTTLAHAAHLPAAAGDALIGRRIAGRYSIERNVGVGAMGAVYRARQSGLERPVALKVLKKDLTWGQDTVARFQREARAMSALTHPNTVRVFDFGATEDGLLYLAMEFLEGELATQHLQARGALEVLDAVRFTQQVLRSLAEAHAKGIVHRDIKPDNVFLARVDSLNDTVVKVLDFGIAKAIEGERAIDQFETLDGTVFGTPRYMSPEQAQGRPLDSRTDIYSTGILLYELLTGYAPFVDDDAVVVMAKHIREAPVPPRQRAPGRPIPASLERVVLKALAKQPDARYQSAEAFDAALEACLPDIEAARSWLGLLRARLGTRTARVAAAVGFGAVWITAGLAWRARDTDAPPPSPRADAPAQQVSGAPRVGEALAQVDTTPAQVPSAAAAADHPEAAEEDTGLVMLHSDPTGAAVWKGDEALGVTPLAVVVEQDQVLQLKLRLEGYQPTRIEVSSGDAQRRIALEPREHRRKPRPAPQPPKAPDPRASRPAPPVNDSPYERFD